MTPREDAAGPAPAGWRIVLALALIGAALGFGWGIADRPLYRSAATVVVESDSQGADAARLERFAQRGESTEVATRAAALLGNDVPGADLLADVTVRPSPRGGYVTVAATAEAPDVAAATADGFARALVDVEGDPLAPGGAAAVPGAPAEDRSAALWAGIGFLAGLLTGLIAVALLGLSARRRAQPAPAAAAPAPDPGAGPMPSAAPAPIPAPTPARPPSSGADPVAEFAGRVGSGVAGFDPGPAGAIVAGAGAVAISRPAVADVGMLADRIGLRSGRGPSSLAVTAVGEAPDAAGLGAALAMAAAGAGRRVLLVEADLAGSGLGARLGIDPAPGLQDYLEGRASPRDVLRNVAAGASGFACVPAGSGTAGAGVAGPRFAALVDRLARVYDLVLYVAPPILGSEDTDAVAELVDGIVVLVGPAVAPKQLDQAAGLLDGIDVPAVAASSR